MQRNTNRNRSAWECWWTAGTAPSRERSKAAVHRSCRRPRKIDPGVTGGRHVRCLRCDSHRRNDAQEKGAATLPNKTRSDFSPGKRTIWREPRPAPPRGSAAHVRRPLRHRHRPEDSRFPEGRTFDCLSSERLRREKPPKTEVCGGLGLGLTPDIYGRGRFSVFGRKLPGASICTKYSRRSSSRN